MLDLSNFQSGQILGARPAGARVTETSQFLQVTRDSHVVEHIRWIEAETYGSEAQQHDHQKKMVIDRKDFANYEFINILYEISKFQMEENILRFSIFRQH
ncbi:hypothetical protein TNCV_3256191 [Trichonephila clavipes]|nr:hypothetical protein TNCV_3256191 [Trichonephila clavipes]